MNRDGLITDLVLGPEAIKISAAMYRLAFPDLHVAVEGGTTTKDIVRLRWTATYKGNRLSNGALGPGPKVLIGTTRSRIAAGKIVETWTEWDRIAVLGELGLLPTE